MNSIGSVLSTKRFSEEPQKDTVLSRVKKDIKFRTKRAKFRYKDALEANKKENIEKEREGADKWLMDSGKRTGHSDSRQTIYYEGGPKTIEDPDRYEFEKDQLARLEDKNEKDAIKYAKSLDKRARHPHISALGAAISSLKEKTHSEKGKDAAIAGGAAAIGVGASVLAKPIGDKISRFNYDRRLRNIEADWAEKTRKIRNKKLTSPTPTSSETGLVQFNNLEIEKINREREMRRLSAAKRYEKGLGRGIKARKLRKLGIAASAALGLGLYASKRIAADKTFSDLEEEEKRLRKKEKVRENNKKVLRNLNLIAAGTVGGTAAAAAAVAKGDVRGKISALKLPKDIKDFETEHAKIKAKKAELEDSLKDSFKKYTEQINKNKAKTLEDLRKKGASKKTLQDIEKLIDLRADLEKNKVRMDSHIKIVEEAEKWRHGRENSRILAADRLYKKNARKINKRTALITAGVTAPFVTAGLIKRYKTDKKLKDARKRLEEKKAQQGK